MSDLSVKLISFFSNDFVGPGHNRSVDLLPSPCDMQDCETVVLVQTLDPLDRTASHVRMKRIGSVTLESHLRPVLAFPVRTAGRLKLVSPANQDSLTHAIRVTLDRKSVV